MGTGTVSILNRLWHSLCSNMSHCTHTQKQKKPQHNLITQWFFFPMTKTVVMHWKNYTWKKPQLSTNELPNRCSVLPLTATTNGPLKQMCCISPIIAASVQPLLLSKSVWLFRGHQVARWNSGGNDFFFFFFFSWWTLAIKLWKTNCIRPCWWIQALLAQLTLVKDLKVNVLFNFQELV